MNEHALDACLKELKHTYKVHYLFPSLRGIKKKRDEMPSVGIFYLGNRQA